MVNIVQARIDRAKGKPNLSNLFEVNGANLLTGLLP